MTAAQPTTSGASSAIPPPRDGRTPRARMAIFGFGWCLGVLLVLIGAFVLGQRSFFWSDVLFLFFIWGGASAAWAIQAGPAGRLSIGHAAYFGIGAYCAAIFQSTLEINVWLAFPGAMFMAALVGAALETLTGRLHHIYYALATFAFAQLLWLIARAWRDVTEGTAGITVNFDATDEGIGKLMFTDPGAYVVLAAIPALLSVIAFILIRSSRVGYFIRALRDSPGAAASIGIMPRRWRALTAALSAALTAMMGIAFFQNMLFVHPDSVLSFQISINILLPALLGGLNIAVGPIIGAAFIIPMRQWLFSGALDLSAAMLWVIYGITLTIIVLFVPGGLAELLRKVYRRARRRLGFGRDERGVSP